VREFLPRQAAAKCLPATCVTSEHSFDGSFCGATQTSCQLSGGGLAPDPWQPAPFSHTRLALSILLCPPRSLFFRGLRGDLSRESRVELELKGGIRLTTLTVKQLMGYNSATFWGWEEKSGEITHDSRVTLVPMVC